MEFWIPLIVGAVVVAALATAAFRVIRGLLGVPETFVLGDSPGNRHEHCWDDIIFSLGLLAGGALGVFVAIQAGWWTPGM